MDLEKFLTNIESKVKPDPSILIMPKGLAEAGPELAMDFLIENCSEENAVSANKQLSELLSKNCEITLDTIKAKLTEQIKDADIKLRNENEKLRNGKGSGEELHMAGNRMRGLLKIRDHFWPKPKKEDGEE
ncbi:MAG: hypothetical protein ACYC3G_02045 [Minisyncoccota bacterium]